MTEPKYTVVRDGDAWGVEWKGALVNDEPMSKIDVQDLADKCNAPEPMPADENPNWEGWD